jgi:hypothetical protein
MHNHKAIRRNIRRAWSRGDSNSHNRGAWSNPNQIFRLPPPGPEFTEAWRFFAPRYTNISLTVNETYQEERTYTITFKDPMINPDFTRTVTEDQTYDFEAVATSSKIKPLGVPFTVPPEARIRHASATAYGFGLYDCRGNIVVHGSTHYVSNPTDTEPPPVVPVDETDTHNISLDYESDETAINGEMTPAMVVARQYFSGPLYKFEPYPRPDQPFLPFPVDEYGVSNVDGSSVEKYHSATFLANLISGGWTDVTIRNSGALSDSETFPDPGDPVDTFSSSHTWSRSGVLNLTIS